MGDLTGLWEAGGTKSQCGVGVIAIVGSPWGEPFLINNVLFQRCFFEQFYGLPFYLFLAILEIFLRAVWEYV